MTNHGETVRLWIGSLGSVVALGAAVAPYRHNSKDRSRAQATHLYCGFTPTYEIGLPGDGLPNGSPQSDGVPTVLVGSPPAALVPDSAVQELRGNSDQASQRFELIKHAELVTLNLYSTSDEPFFNITIWITDAHGIDQAATRQDQLEPHVRVRHVAYFERGTLPASPLHVRLEFQDANGRSWQRIDTGPVWQRRHLTPTRNTSTSTDYVDVPIRPKPDFYSTGLRASRSMRADQAPGLSDTTTR